MKSRIALVCATEAEAAPLLSGLSGLRQAELGPGTFVLGSQGPLGVALCIAGVGKVNAAQALTLLAERVPIWAAVSFGIGGAYPGGGLALGDVAVATLEIHGDEGVETAAGYRGLETIGLPPEARVKRSYPADAGLVKLLAQAGRRENKTTVKGEFVTVSLCTGSAGRARSMRRRFRAVCENMEGAAVAQVACSYGIPFAELRGISNAVGPRDRRGWAVGPAIDAAGLAMNRFLRTLSRSAVP